MLFKWIKCIKFYEGIFFNDFMILVALGQPFLPFLIAYGFALSTMGFAVYPTALEPD